MSDNIYICKHCGKSFNTKQALGGHAVTHVKTIYDTQFELYNQNPKLCLQCQNPIPYEKRNNKFCGSSCGATYSNKRKGPRSEISKQKTRETLSNRKRVPRQPLPPKTNIEFCQCKICDKKFVWNNITKGSKKCCSKECSIKNFSLQGRKNKNIGVKRSKDEIKLFELCDAYYNNVTNNEKIFNFWDADILLNDYKIAILWNGPWHYQDMPGLTHSLKQVQNRDRIKKKEIEKAGWSLLTYEDRFFTPQSAFDDIKRHITY